MFGSRRGILCRRPCLFSRVIRVSCSNCDSDLVGAGEKNTIFSNHKHTQYYSLCNVSGRALDTLSQLYWAVVLLHHDWCNKGRGMCYPVCGMVHIKELLLLIEKSSLCGGSGFPLSSEWPLTICLTPYNRK